MNSFINYNFLLDGNSVDPVPTNANPINNITILNGEIDYIYITEDTDITIDTPAEWNEQTTIYANYVDSLEGGNIPSGTLDFNRLDIIRNDGNGWKVLKEYEINEPADLAIEFVDNLAVKGTSRYALLRVNNDVPMSINGLITEVVLNFPHCYLSNAEQTFVLQVGVKYTNTNQVSPSAIFEPIGRKYPIYVSNAVTNYQSGGITATVLDTDYLADGLNRYNRKQLAELRDNFVQFVIDSNIKLYQDWNGNSWIIIVHDNPNIDFIDISDNAIADVQFNYVQMGDSEDLADWKTNGLIVDYYEHLEGE